MQLLRAGPTGSRLPVKRAVQVLGLALIPDPDRLMYLRVKDKLLHIRNVLRQGGNPLSGRERPPASYRTYKWREWLQRAFMFLPERTGTVSDAAAVISADPDLIPILDCRPARGKVVKPMWRHNLGFYVRSYPEFVRTGERRGRGRELVYTYDEQVACECSKPATKPKKRGAPGLPHLGKRSN